MMIVKSLKVVTSLGIFVYTCYVLFYFMYFLSNLTDQQPNQDYFTNDEKTISNVLLILLHNATLLSIFIIQHSVMATQYVKDVYKKINLEDLERSFYNLSCAALLHFLIVQWKSLSWISLWNIDLNRNNHIWMVMVSTHILTWFIIYSGCVMMDVPELTGMKQVYYSLSARPPPMNLKSANFKRFLGHMRHPSFIGFLIIFWVHPVMSVDRLLMAILMTLYMITMWDIDKQDFCYHAEKIERKKMRLSLH